MYKRLAKSISYSTIKRSLNSIKFIVIHYTGNVGDTAKNNVDYFATGNNAQAGAHYFIDRSGTIGRSITLDRTAWAVGGNRKTGMKGEARYYGICTNANSVSIELCDIATKEPSEKQIKACKKLIKLIRKKCPNANTVIRHFDVNGKLCPSTMVGERNERWEKIKKAIT